MTVPVARRWRPGPIRVKARSKYAAERASYNGHLYASILEADYARHLDLLLLAGELRSVERQRRIRLEVNGHHICDYIPDFDVEWPDGSRSLIEAKGFETPEWKLKARLTVACWLPANPGYDYRVVRRDRGGRWLVQTYRVGDAAVPSGVESRPSFAVKKRRLRG